MNSYFGVSNKMGKLTIGRFTLLVLLIIVKKSLHVLHELQLYYPFVILFFISAVTLQKGIDGKKVLCSHFVGTAMFLRNRCRVFWYNFKNTVLQWSRNIILYTIF